MSASRYRGPASPDGLCGCGCGAAVDHQFVLGHNQRGVNSRKVVTGRSLGTDYVIEVAIKAGTLGLSSPFYGWTLKRFKAPGPHHIHELKAKPGPKPKRGFGYQ